MTRFPPQLHGKVEGRVLVEKNRALARVGVSLRIVGELDCASPILATEVRCCKSCPELH